MMIQTMLAEFKHVSLWIPNRMEGVVIGSNQPLQIDLKDWQERINTPSVYEDLQAVGMESAEHLAATFVAADHILAQFIGDAPLVTDNHPRIEYHNFYRRGIISYEELLKFREPVSKYIDGSFDPERLEKATLVVENIWREHEATANGDHQQARSFIQSARTIEKENVYLNFLEAVNRRQLPTQFVRTEP